ncbi:MAG: selenium metabolism-associated LysR family transcriptional regulator [Coriobacteriia bacterium]|nr:selenium metabolism-associated LysR family transcriptional regulator [Coriobacteriia bacterium]
MNVQQLKTFITVVEHGSFSEAARALGVSQPAVTMQVQSLESDVGATLLDRRYRRVDLTEAGRTLLPHARHVLEQIGAARDEIDALSGVISGRLVIAASTTPGVYIIPRLLGAFVTTHPEVGVTIMVHDTAEVIEAVESGHADIGITGATVRGARVAFEEVGADELVLICAPDSPLAQRKNLPLAELADEPWVLRESGSGTRQVAERLATDHGLDPDELRVVVELGTGEAIVSAVEGGLGISILSRHVAAKALALGTICEVDALGLPATRPLHLVLPRRSPSRAAEAFHEYLQEAFARQ